MTAAPHPLRSLTDHRAFGLTVAIMSAATFGASGPFVKPLLNAGWSPTAAVAVRAGGAAVVLLPAVLFSLRGRLNVLGRTWRRIALYGIFAIAGAQLCYFAAVQRLPVGVALLIEFTAPVLLVGLAWVRTRVTPHRLTLVGAVVSIAGLGLVLDLTGTTSLDPIGVLWALSASVCVAAYFLLSAAPNEGLPPVALAGAGLVFATITLVAMGLVGVLPFDAVGGDVDLLGSMVPWYVPMGVIVVISTAFAYVTGITAVARLGERVSSFVALLEVLFAVLLSWLLLDQTPSLLQAAGGTLIIGGVILVSQGQARVALEAAAGLVPTGAGGS